MAKIIYFHRAYAPFNGGETAVLDDSEGLGVIAKGLGEEVSVKAAREAAEKAAAEAVVPSDDAPAPDAKPPKKSKS